ncbi:MAG: pilin [Patescibacteria group bacterium]
MIQKIKTILFSLIFALMGVVPGLAVAGGGVAYAAEDIGGNLCAGANIDLTGADKECKKDADASTFQTTLERIINLISIIVGVVAVIMIIFGGFKYITSGGKEESVKGAKNTILYGLIGLVIVALAQIIVKFVLNQTKI